MLHRLIFAFALIASFGLAQVGATAHEISHYSNATSQSKSPESLPHNQVCEKCIGYAGLGSVINNTDTHLPNIATDNYFLVRYFASFSYTKPATYRARAPPYLA